MEEFIKIIGKSILSIEGRIVIEPEMELINDIGLTSLDMMVIVCELERRYNKKIGIEKLMNVKTVNDLFLLVQ